MVHIAVEEVSLTAARLCIRRSLKEQNWSCPARLGPLLRQLAIHQLVAFLRTVSPETQSSSQALRYEDISAGKSKHPHISKVIIKAISTQGDLQVLVTSWNRHRQQHYHRHIADDPPKYLLNQKMGLERVVHGHYVPNWFPMNSWLQLVMPSQRTCTFRASSATSIQASAQFLSTADESNVNNAMYFECIHFYPFLLCWDY